MAIGDGGKGLKGAAAKGGARASRKRASREELGEVWHASGIRRWTWLSMEKADYFPRYVGWIQFCSANILQTSMYSSEGNWQFVPGKPNQLAVTFGSYEHILEMVSGRARPMFELVGRVFTKGVHPVDSHHVVQGVPYVFPTTWAVYMQDTWAPLISEKLPSEVIDVEEMPQETPPQSASAEPGRNVAAAVVQPAQSLADMLAPPTPHNRSRTRSREPSARRKCPSPAHMHLMGCLPVRKRKR